MPSREQRLQDWDKGGDHPGGSEPPLTLLSAPAGLLPMGEGLGTLAKTTATSRRTAVGTVTLTATDALPAGHPASPSAEELVPGVSQTHRVPACLPPAACERW